MKTNIKSLLFVMVMLLSLASCHKSRDVEEILGTVPRTTGIVAAVDLESVLKKADCTSGISPEINAMISKMSPKEARVTRAILEGKAGIAPTSATVFEDSGDMVATFYLDDEKKFMNFFSADMEENVSWDSTDGGYVASNTNNGIVVYKNQAWIFSDNGSVTRAKQYLSLGEDHSVLGLKCADRLTSDKDVSMMVNINKMINFARMSVSEASQFRMALSTMFENARYVVGTLELNNGEAEAEFNVLNEDFNPAATTLKFAKLSKADVAKFPGDAVMIFGAALSQEAVSKLAEQMNTMHMPADVAEMLSHLRGEMLVGMSPDAFGPYSYGKGVGVMLTFDSDSYASQAANMLKSQIGSSAQIKINGSSVYVSMDMPAGHPSASLVDAIDGAGVGAAVNISALAATANVPAMSMWQTGAVTLEKDGSGVKIKAEVKATDSSANILRTLLKFISEADN